MGFVKVTKEVLEDEYNELMKDYETDVEVREAIDLFNAECELRKKSKDLSK